MFLACLLYCVIAAGEPVNSNSYVVIVVNAFSKFVNLENSTWLCEQNEFTLAARTHTNILTTQAQTQARTNRHETVCSAFVSVGRIGEWVP